MTLAAITRGLFSAPRIFHSMENFSAVFPCYGKMFSTVWKTFPARHLQDVTFMPAVRRTWMQRISFGFGRGCYVRPFAHFNTFDFHESRVRPPQAWQARKRILQNEGLDRQNMRSDGPMMARCGRPERDLCRRVVGLDAPGRIRRAFVLPPRFLKSFSAGSIPPSPP
jgi:hypothetical protein